MDPNVVILAAGSASRMKRPAASGTDIHPRLAAEAAALTKGMLSVGPRARPFLDYLLLTVERSGYRDVALVIGENDSTVRHYYEQGRGADSFPDLSFTFVTQPIPPGRTKPPGTADALLRALRAVPRWKGGKLTVCNSDNLYSRRAFELLRADDHPNCLIDYDRAALQFGPDRISQFAVITRDPAGFLSAIIEKPSPEEIRRATDPTGRVGVSMNIFRFSYDQIVPFLEEVPMHPVRQESELPAAVRLLIERKPGAVYALPLAEHVIDLTEQTDIPVVQQYLAREFPDF